MAKVISIVKMGEDIINALNEHNLTMSNRILHTILNAHENNDRELVENTYNEIPYQIKVQIFKSAAVTVIEVREAEKWDYVFCRTIPHQFEEQRGCGVLDKAKNIYHGVRARKLCDALKTTKTPMEAYTLLLDFLGESGQISGTIAKKDMVMDYHFENNQESKTVTVSMNARTKNGDRLIELDINLNETNVEMFHDSMMALMNMCR